MGLADLAEHIGSEVLELTALCAYEYIAITESQCLSLLIELHTIGHILNRDIGIAPSEEYHRIDEQCQEEVEQYPANHHEKSLPGRL